MSEFKVWSEINPEAGKELKPDFRIRSWDDLSKINKESMWHYLNDFFVNANAPGDGWGLEEYRYVIWAISTLDELYIAKNYAPHYRSNKTEKTAYSDFKSIFLNQLEVVVLELLSIYALTQICAVNELEVDTADQFSEHETEPRTEEQKDYDKWNKFDTFAGSLNKAFEAFGVNVTLTRAGFTPRQEKKIETEIYEPVLKKLSDPKWKPVNEKLTDAFKDYREKDYSSSVTHAVSSVQAFLQILVKEKIGQGSIADLLTEARNQKLIPNDSFSSTILKDIEKVFARERQAVGNAHPTTEKATAKHARLVLNLAMVFFEHCL